MRSRKTQSSNPPLPAPAGPLFDPPLYPLAPEQQRLFELHEAEVRSAVSAVLEEAAREEGVKERRRRAGATGRRAGMISSRWHATGAAPYLRLSGRWLGAAGFDLGQSYEVEVGPGRLVIRAV